MNGKRKNWRRFQCKARLNLLILFRIEQSCKHAGHEYSPLGLPTAIKWPALCSHLPTVYFPWNQPIFVPKEYELSLIPLRSKRTRSAYCFAATGIYQGCHLADFSAKFLKFGRFKIWLAVKSARCFSVYFELSSSFTWTNAGYFFLLTAEFRDLVWSASRQNKQIICHQTRIFFCAKQAL